MLPEIENLRKEMLIILKTYEERITLCDSEVVKLKSDKERLDDKTIIINALIKYCDKR